MIEVEEKFQLTDSAKKQINKSCKFLREVKLHDRYFDFQNNRLFLSDTWLRDRNGKLQLKYPIHQDGHFNYKEYYELEEIYKKLDLKYLVNEKDNWQKVLDKNKLTPHIDYISIRKKYECEDFIIDVDTTNFDFDLFEIELEVNNKSQIKEAEDRIFDFLKRYNIKTKHFQSGKAIVYLKKFKPKIYNALVKSGWRVD